MPYSRNYRRSNRMYKRRTGYTLSKLSKKVYKLNKAISQEIQIVDTNYQVVPGSGSTHAGFNYTGILQDNNILAFPIDPMFSKAEGTNQAKWMRRLLTNSEGRVWNNTSSTQMEIEKWKDIANNTNANIIFGNHIKRKGFRISMRFERECWQDQTNFKDWVRIPGPRPSVAGVTDIAFNGAPIAPIEMRVLLIRKTGDTLKDIDMLKRIQNDFSGKYGFQPVDTMHIAYDKRIQLMSNKTYELKKSFRGKVGKENFYWPLAPDQQMQTEFSKQEGQLFLIVWYNVPVFSGSNYQVAGCYFPSMYIKIRAYYENPVIN